MLAHYHRQTNLKSIICSLNLRFRSCSSAYIGTGRSKLSYVLANVGEADEYHHDIRPQDARRVFKT